MAGETTSVQRAFSKQADHYDTDDSSNQILAAWRKKVYAHLNLFLKPSTRILELNAGTGIDALHLVQPERGGRRIIVAHHGVRSNADLGEIHVEQGGEDIMVRHVNQRRGLQRRADTLGRAFDFQRAGHDAADVTDGLPLRGQRVVAECVEPFGKQCQMHRGLGVRPVEPPGFVAGEAQYRREPSQDRVADNIDGGKRRFPRQ